jgi:hypothetical protein
MQRRLTRCMALVLGMVALMVAGHGDGLAGAGTATPDVAGMWEGDWSHRIGSGQMTLRLAQEGTKVIGKQSVVGVIPIFGEQQGRQLRLGEEVRDGQIMDSILMFHVEAPDTPGGQVNFTLTVSGDAMTGTVCGYTCGVVKLKRSKI